MKMSKFAIVLTLIVLSIIVGVWIAQLNVAPRDIYLPQPTHSNRVSDFKVTPFAVDGEKCYKVIDPATKTIFIGCERGAAP